MKLLVVVAKVALVVLCCTYLISGIFVVRPGEQAFILRFGEPVKKNGSPVVFSPGNWHWSWPKPIDLVVRIPVKQGKTVLSSSFWYNEKDGLLEKQANPAATHPLVPGIDGYLLTGDKNILHSKWSISYLISDPITYYNSHRFPENAVQYALDNSILKVVATTPIEKALYQGSEELRLKVLDLVEKKIGQLNLGIAVTNVSLPKKEPPSSTKSHFSAVVEAEQKKSQTLTEAKGYAERTLQETLGKCTKIIAEAEGFRNRIVSAVKADEKYFLKILAEYQKAPETMLLTLHSKAMNEVLSKVDQKFIIHAAGEGLKQEIRLLMNTDWISKKNHQSTNP